MFCEYCGKKIPDGSKFCVSCGKPMKAQSVGAKEGEGGGKALHEAPRKGQAKGSRGMVLALEIVLGLLVAAVLVLGGVFLYKNLTPETSDDGEWLEKDAGSTEREDQEDESETEDDPAAKVSSGTEAAAEETEEEEAEDIFSKNEDETAQEEDGKAVFGKKGTDYIFPQSDTRKLTEEEIEDMLDQSDDPEWDIRIAINELYARHGRIFDTPEIREYFEGMDWYEGTIDGEEFDKNQNDILNDVEIYNRDLLSVYRKELQG